MKYTVLTHSFPGKSNYGALGLSATILIETNGKKILFDTGAHGAVKVLLEALKARNVEPNEIDFVFLSHLHFDHINNIGLFQKADFYIGETEWMFAQSLKKEIWMPPESILYLKECCKIHLVNDGDEILPGVKVISSFGHTCGHMSLMLKTTDGIVVLAGDAVKNRSELMLETVDQSSDVEKSVESIRKIKEIADLVIPGHDSPLRIKNKQVIPEKDLYWEITLPIGFHDEGKKSFLMCIKK